MANVRPPDRAGFRERIKALIAEAGGQAPLSARTNIAQQNFSNYATGLSFPRSLATQRNLAEQLNVRLEWLIYGEGGRSVSDAPAANEGKERSRPLSALAGFIERHGDPNSVGAARAMLEELDRQVRARQAASGDSK